ncbi:MAG TPA: hypothetical protein PKE06_26460, partial [Flavilitoribacter sp.]|nr:hypothetical protein [Flavilitoribacter sp.]
MTFRNLILAVLAGSIFANIQCPAREKPATGSPIDRRALVSRHNVVNTGIDSLESLTVGNGNFAFTADVSGLQSFPDYYENGVSLGTESNWGWHSFPNAGDYALEDVARTFTSCNGRETPYAPQHKNGRAGEATNWLRSNPHRLHLGLIGLVFTKSDGTEASIRDLKNIRQELDLWTGKLESRYEVEGQPVKVELYCHQNQDLISVRVESPLIEAGRLKVRFRFPYGKDCHVCPGYDWDHPEKHRTSWSGKPGKIVVIDRTLDSTRYFVGLKGNGGVLYQNADHQIELKPEKGQKTLDLTVVFQPDEINSIITDFETTKANNEKQWPAFWQSGGAIDFSACTDPRAFELERRVVLSEYLTKIQCSGYLPPQETGLTFNSWYGKFHLEMHWWHGVHFPLWGRPDLLENSLKWYPAIIGNARKTAEWQGYDGVRWPKMTDPQGRESPSSVGVFLAWQQPHPIYFAELMYRQNPDESTLGLYRQLVFQTADFMASYACKGDDGKYHLVAPLIPAQEIFPAERTQDPPFELVYWHYALSAAQEWRKRLGMEPDKRWQDVIDNLTPLAVRDGLYLPDANCPDAYTNDEFRRDHPVVTGAYGMLPATPLVDPELMANTFTEIMNKWNWATTWGWDYPMLAMTAARLGQPEKAIDALFMDAQKNTYLKNGHNYQDQRLRIYLPGNGGLLTAVAMMAAGWDNAPDRPNPGFPDDGRWKVKWEGL